jgi:hypothetical protein
VSATAAGTETVVETPSTSAKALVITVRVLSVFRWEVLIRNFRLCRGVLRCMGREANYRCKNGGAYAIVKGR